MTRKLILASLTGDWGVHENNWFRANGVEIVEHAIERAIKGRTRPEIVEALKHIERLAELARSRSRYPGAVMSCGAEIRLGAVEGALEKPRRCWGWARELLGGGEKMSEIQERAQVLFCSSGNGRIPSGANRITHPITGQASSVKSMGALRGDQQTILIMGLTRWL